MNKKLDYFRNKINEIGLCHSIKQNNPIFYDELMDIFKSHPDYPDKFISVVDVSIAFNKINPKKCYELQLISDKPSNEPVSYRKCFQKVSKDNNLKMAMRYSVSDQILEFKNKCDKLICDICKSKQNIQIDHVILFKQLYDNFLLQNKLPIPTQFDSTYYNSAKFKSNDVEFENSWSDYHKQHAILRCLCNKCNLTRSKK